MRLAGRKILITGGASGLGLAAAHAFAREGAKVAILDRDRAGAEAAAKSSGAIAVEADVLNEASVKMGVDEAGRALGGLDGLINSAGVAFTATIEDTDLDSWQWVVGTNLTGTYLVVRSAVPWLRQASTASIVNISSGQGLLPGPLASAYAASKGGILALTKVLSRELAPKIRVNAICPGMVNTPMHTAAMSRGRTQAELNAMLEAYAQKRLGQPDEIANALLFLTSNESSLVTGATLAIDGGRTFH